MHTIEKKVPTFTKLPMPEPLISHLTRSATRMSAGKSERSWNLLSSITAELVRSVPWPKSTDFALKIWHDQHGLSFQIISSEMLRLHGVEPSNDDAPTD